MRFALLAVGFALVAPVLLTGCDDGDGGGGPRQVSAGELAELASDTGHEVYWAGERPDTQIEFEQTDDGLVYVRYLPSDGEVDEQSRKSALTIGTYPRENAFADLEKLAQQPDMFKQDLPDGGIAVLNKSQASSVYIAYPDSALQIEVYEPDPATALKVGLSGEAVPVP